MNIDTKMNTNYFVDPYKMKVFEEADSTMNPQWRSIYKELPLCDVNVMTKNNNAIFVISGMLKGNLLMLAATQQVVLHYIAANSPTYNGSFSGSGLPYPNEHVAFENTENEGVVEVINGRFSFSIRYPNSYYKELGTILVPPQVKIRVCSKSGMKPLSDIQVIQIGQGIPFRSLTYPYQRNYINGPLFYDNTSMPPVRSQYQILIDSKYPNVNKMPANFWGKKPPK
jgi:hypothetical protein